MSKKTILFLTAVMSIGLTAWAGDDGGHNDKPLSCADLAKAKLHPPEDATSLTIDSTALVPADPGSGLPEYCLVQGHLDTEINFVMKLPTTWNSKLLMIGNFRFAGFIPYLDGGLYSQYATVGTDTGHSTDFPWGWDALQGRPDRIANFQYRAIHLVALSAKQIVKAFYAASPKHAYFQGCSSGGRQALLEASDHPDDFDGIIAGAPALPAGGFQLWDAKVLFPGGPDTGVLPWQKVALLSQLVLTKCDARDGVVDGIVDDPRDCNFSPKRDLPNAPTMWTGPIASPRHRSRRWIRFTRARRATERHRDPRFTSRASRAFPTGPIMA